MLRARHNGAGDETDDESNYNRPDDVEHIIIPFYWSRFGCEEDTIRKYPFERKLFAPPLVAAVLAQELCHILIALIYRPAQSRITVFGIFGVNIGSVIQEHFP